MVRQNAYVHSQREPIVGLPTCVALIPILVFMSSIPGLPEWSIGLANDRVQSQVILIIVPGLSFGKRKKRLYIYIYIFIYDVICNPRL